MNDRAIRNLLRRTELLSYLNDHTSKVVEELKLPVAGARIDIAIVNGHLHGYEIKSASDTLQRLPGQIDAYSKVFDYITVVTEAKYYEKVLSWLPEYVGVSVCSEKDGDADYEVIIPPLLNPNKQGFYIAKLLWREELIQLVKDLQIPFDGRKRSWTLSKCLDQHLNVETISKYVREIIKKRENWKLKQTVNQSEMMV